jgi:hypothetical protein
MNGIFFYKLIKQHNYAESSQCRYIDLKHQLSLGTFISWLANIEKTQM